jgi:hypothetical protein
MRCRKDADTVGTERTDPNPVIDFDRTRAYTHHAVHATLDRLVGFMLSILNGTPQFTALDSKRSITRLTAAS